MSSTESEETVDNPGLNAKEMSSTESEETVDNPGLNAKEMSSTESEETVDNPGEDGNQTANLNGVDIVVKMIIDITKNVQKEAEYKTKVESLGITSPSDFQYVDYAKDFSDTLLPVEIGKLKQKISTFGVDEDKESELQPAVIEVTDIFSQSFVTSVLLSKKRVSKVFRTKISEAVGQELWLKYKKRSVPERICLNVANFLTKKYPDALRSPILKENSQLGRSIFNHIRYLIKLEKKNQRNLDPTLPPANFSPRENIGLDADRDAPTSLPEGETLTSQQAKKKQLFDMKESGNINSKEVLKLMKATYVSQRHFIQTKVTADKLLEEWPFFAKFSCLQFHFSYLMKIEQHETRYVTKMEDFNPKFIAFVTSEANQRLTARASEAAKLRSQILKDILKRLNKNTITASSEFSAIILSVGCLMSQQDLSKLFIYFTDTTNVHEVQASPNLPKTGIPMVAVLGKDILLDPKTLVLVDNVVVSEPQASLKSILSVFMLYWVLKVKIPKGIGGVMEFIQRAIFDLDVPSRVERVRSANNKSWSTNPKKMSEKYAALMSKYEDHRESWESH